MYLPALSVGKNKLDVRSEGGVWLGINLECGESIVGTAGGVAKTKDFKRKPRRKEDVGATTELTGSKESRGSRAREQEVVLKSIRRSDCRWITRGSLSTSNARVRMCRGGSGSRIEIWRSSGSKSDTWAVGQRSLGRRRWVTRTLRCKDREAIALQLLSPSFATSPSFTGARTRVTHWPWA